MRSPPIFSAPTPWLSQPIPRERGCSMKSRAISGPSRPEFACCGLSAVPSRTSCPKLVAPEGLEPPTCGLGNRCSILLSYGAAKGQLSGGPRRVNDWRDQPWICGCGTGRRCRSAGKRERTLSTSAGSISAKRTPRCSPMSSNTSPHGPITIEWP